MSEEKKQAVEFMIQSAAHWNIIASFYSKREGQENLYHDAINRAAYFLAQAEIEMSKP